MNSHSMLRRLVLTAVSLILVAGSVFAQSAGSGPAGNPAYGSKKVTVKDAELKRFATALKDVHVIQVEFQKSFQKAVSQSPLSRKRFLEIYRSERTTHKLPADASSAEKQQYQQLFQSVLTMERHAHTKMVEAVRKDGMKVARFDAIIRAVNTDPSLAQRLQKFR